MRPARVALLGTVLRVLSRSAPTAEFSAWLAFFACFAFPISFYFGTARETHPSVCLTGFPCACTKLGFNFVFPTAYALFADLAGTAHTIRVGGTRAPAPLIIMESAMKVPLETLYYFAFLKNYSNGQSPLSTQFRGELPIMEF